MVYCFTSASFFISHFGVSLLLLFEGPLFDLCFVRKDLSLRSSLSLVASFFGSAYTSIYITGSQRVKKAIIISIFLLFDLSLHLHVCLKTELAARGLNLKDYSRFVTFSHSLIWSFFESTCTSMDTASHQRVKKTFLESTFRSFDLCILPSIKINLLVYVSI